MKPPYHNPTNRPPQIHGAASCRSAGTDSVGTPMPGVNPNLIEKPKSQTQGDRLFEIYLAKTIAEAQKLGKLNLPQSALERAAITLAERKTKKRLNEAYKYAVNSAKSETITEAEILAEVMTKVMTEIGITTLKLCPKEAKKKGSKGHE